MGCGASSGDKYKGEAVASTAKGDAKGADAEPAKEAPVKTEPPPEKPPQEESAPVAEEIPAEAAKEEARLEATAAEPPADARPEAAEAPPAEAPAAEAPAATEAAAEAPQPSEPAQSVAAEAVVAEAEAALAESEPQVEPTPTTMTCEDPEFPSFRGMSNASALLELDRSSGSRLGISVRGAESVLLITKVEEDGLVPAWNQEHPERVVRPGNCIIQVNGLCGFADQILEELQSEQPLRVEVDRTEREVRAPLSSDGMAHWCREQIQQVYERHDEAGLKTLDRRMTTYKDRELALYRTLSKKFGEEPKDPELCANSVEDVEL